MFINFNPKFVYVSFTKSGSSSIYSVLKTNFKGTTRPRHHKNIPDKYASYPSFCVVRNPYSRMVSWWWSICKTPGDRYGHKKELKKMGQPETLSGFLRLWQTKKGTSQYTGIELNDKFNYILKLESLEQDFNALPFLDKKISIPRSNKRDHPHWKQLIDKQSGKLINDIYYKDFEYFGYEIINFDD